MPAPVLTTASSPAQSSGRAAPEYGALGATRAGNGTSPYRLKKKPTASSPLRASATELIGGRLRASVRANGRPARLGSRGEAQGRRDPCWKSACFTTER